MRRNSTRSWQTRWQETAETHWLLALERRSLLRLRFRGCQRLGSNRCRSVPLHHLQHCPGPSSRATSGQQWRGVTTGSPPRSPNSRLPLTTHLRHRRSSARCHNRLHRHRSCRLSSIRSRFTAVSADTHRHDRPPPAAVLFCRL